MIEQQVTMEATDVKEYTISEAAELLNVDRSTVWRWIKQGVFKDWRKKGFGETSPLAISEESLKDVANQLGVTLEENGNK